MRLPRDAWVDPRWAEKRKVLVDSPLVAAPRLRHMGVVLEFIGDSYMGGGDMRGGQIVGEVG